MDPRNTTTRRNPVGEDYWADDKNDWEDEEAYAEEDEEDAMTQLSESEDDDYYDNDVTFGQYNLPDKPKTKEPDSDVIYDDSIGYTNLYHPDEEDD